jgi:hypothetical protein
MSQSLSNIFISPHEEFFSKEIKDYQSGNCYNNREIYPCYHPRMRVIYADGSEKYFDMSAFDMERLCGRLNRPLPPHFEYMKVFKNPPK